MRSPDSGSRWVQLATGAALLCALVPISLDSCSAWRARRATESAAAMHLQRAGAAVAARDFTQAELALRAALDLTPRDPQVRRELMRVQALFVAAAPERLAGGGDLEAFRYTLQVLGAYSGHAREAAVYVAAGHLELQRGHAERAQEMYAKALAVDSKSAEAHMGLGAIHHGAGRAQEALAAYEAAFAAAPNNLQAANNLGVQYVDLGRVEAGVEMFARAVALSDNAASRMNLGNAVIKLGRTQEAAEHLQRATELAPSSAQAWRRLGALRYQLGEYDHAAAALQRSLGLEQDAATAVNLAQAQQALGWHEAAAKLLRQLLGTYPDAYRGAYHLGVSLEALGERLGAITAYERFLRDAPPEDALREQARARVAALR